MRILLLLAMLSTSLATHAQTTFSFTIPQDIATQEWVKKYVQQKIDSIKAATPTTAPSETLPPCPEGPEIKSLTNISQDYLTLKFHGIDVTDMYWWIVSENARTKPLRSGNIHPSSSTVKLDYDTLPPGKYYFGVMGTKCSGSNTKEFTIR